MGGGPQNRLVKAEGRTEDLLMWWWTQERKVR